VLLALVLVPLLALGVFVLDLIVHDNFHVVSAGILYRSSQMNAADLAQAIREHGIKSILNLRGPGPGQSWYSSEISVAQRYHVEHFDFSLSASRELKDDEMDQILATIEHAPKPMLVHCKSGSDRAGLVGALYLYAIEGLPAPAASRQLTALYGHLPHLFWDDTIAMDKSFQRYVSNHLHRAGLPGAHDPDAGQKQAASSSDAYFAHTQAQ
jgi:undecaprenyl-diphosphatase